MSRGASALIDCGALKHNLEQVRKAAPTSRILAVIKANGYGHGIVRVAQALADADAFAIACIEEGIALRNAGVRQPLVLLQGVVGDGELAVAVEHGLDLVVHHAEQVALLERTRISKPVSVWLKIDTGMHRLGFPPEQATEIMRRLQAADSVAPGIRLVTHLANSEDVGDKSTQHQLDRFAEALQGVAAERSIANSAAVLGWPAAHAEWVRPGLMLYGVSPFPNRDAASLGLRPAMTLSTRLIAINRRRQGETIGYGGTWVCPEDMQVGVAAIGYGDGYPRHAPNGTPVLLNGRRVSLIGRVSMDMICLDLRSQPDAEIGDPVVLWGQELPVEEVASGAGTIPYELLCRVTQRVRFEEKR